MRYDEIERLDRWNDYRDEPPESEAERRTCEDEMRDDQGEGR